MSTFKQAFDSIASGIEDLSSLEVISYKGTISIKSEETCPESFDSILKKAQTEADFKIIACTTSKLDGDVKVFYDKDITKSDMDAHLQMVVAAQKNRQGFVEMFKEAISDAIS